jgi:hypothetical protein
MFKLVPAQRPRVRFVDDGGTETLCPPRTGETEFLINVRNLEQADKGACDTSGEGDKTKDEDGNISNSGSLSAPPSSHQTKKRDRAETAAGPEVWPFQHVAAELRSASQEALQLLQLADLIHKQKTFQLDNVIRQPASHQTRYDEYAVNIKRKRHFLEETLSVLRSGVVRVERARTREQEHFETLRQLQRRWGITAPAHGKVLSALRAHEHLAVDCHIPSLDSEPQQQQQQQQSDTAAMSTRAACTEARIFQSVSHNREADSAAGSHESIESRVAVAMDTLCTLQVRVLNCAGAGADGPQHMATSNAFALPIGLRQSASRVRDHVSNSHSQSVDDLANDELLALQLHSESCRALFLRVCHEAASEDGQASISAVPRMVGMEMSGIATGGGGAGSGVGNSGAGPGSATANATSGSAASGGAGSSFTSSAVCFPGLDGAAPRGNSTFALAGATHSVRLMAALASVTAAQQQSETSVAANATSRAMMRVRRLSAVERVRYQVIQEQSSRIVVSAGMHRQLEFTLLPLREVVLEREGGTLARTILLEMQQSYRAAVFDPQRLRAGGGGGGDVLLSVIRSAVGIAQHLSMCQQLLNMWTKVARERRNANAEPLVFQLRHVASMHSVLRFEIANTGGGRSARGGVGWDGEICVVAGVPEVVSFRANGNGGGDGRDVSLVPHGQLPGSGGGGGADGIVGLTIQRILHTLATARLH